MPIAFLINNLHFALALLGAVVMLMATWLTVDAYRFRPEGPVLTRAMGLGLYAVWQIIYAVNGGDVMSYLGFGLLLLGLVLILGSFLTSKKLEMQAVVVLPAFAVYTGVLHIAAFVLLSAIAFFSYRQGKKEFNKTWIPFSVGFAFLALGAAFSVFAKNELSVGYLGSSVCELIGFIFIARWTWQYLQLRLRESLMLIFISAALFLSTVVTLAFSTILISQITQQTDASLLTDARVLSLNVQGLSEQALAKTTLIAGDSTLKTAITKNDFATLEQTAEGLMESYNLGFVTITDAQGTVLVRAHALSKRGDSLAGERALEEALLGKPFSTIEKSPVEGLSVRAGAPIVGDKGKIIGVVVAGYPLDNALLDNMKRLTGLDMFVYDTQSSLAATALGVDGRTRLTGLPVPASVNASVLAAAQTTTARVELGGVPFEASFLPLVNADQKTIGIISAAKPEADIIDLENATNRLTLIAVSIIMLVLLWPMYLFTKRLSKED